MAILWCGGEDIDFPNGATASVQTSGARRTAYARCGLYSTSTTSPIKSVVFPGGAVTSAWLSAQVMLNGSAQTSHRAIGFGRSGASVGALMVGTSSSSSTKLAIWKWDGTTWTQLSTESGTSLSIGPQYKLDMQVISYGATATVNVYIGGTLLITYTGDVTVTGVTNLDSVWILGSGVYYWYASEIIVADEDTRSLSLVTHAPSSIDTSAWTGAASDINETTINDATVLSASSASLESKLNLTDLPYGYLQPKAIKIATRAMADASGPQTLKLGQQVQRMALVGTDTVGSQSTLGVSANNKYLRKILPGESASLNAIRIIPSSNSTAKIKGLLYADSSGVPGARLAISNESTGTTANTPIDLIFGSPYSLVSGTAYWIGLIIDTTLNYLYTDNTQSGLTNGNTYATPSDPAGSMGNGGCYYTLPLKDSGQAVNVDAGRALTTAWATYERLLATNPETSATWTQAEVNALELDLQSAT